MYGSQHKSTQRLAIFTKNVDNLHFQISSQASTCFHADCEMLTTTPSELDLLRQMYPISHYSGTKQN